MCWSRRALEAVVADQEEVQSFAAGDDVVDDRARHRVAILVQQLRIVLGVGEESSVVSLDSADEQDFWEFDCLSLH